MITPHHKSITPFAPAEMVSFSTSHPQPDLHQFMDKVDPISLLHTALTIFALITASKNLLKYIGKMLKRRKGDQLDPRLSLRLLGAILVILKSIGQFMDDDQ
jgi:hypothetical protein